MCPKILRRSGRGVHSIRSQVQICQRTNTNRNHSDKASHSSIRDEHFAHGICRKWNAKLPLECQTDEDLFFFQLGEHIVKFRILYNGATIMHCNKYIVEYQKKYMDQHVGSIVSANQRNILAKNLMEISTVKVWTVSEWLAGRYKETQGKCHLVN